MSKCPPLLYRHNPLPCLTDAGMWYINKTSKYLYSNKISKHTSSEVKTVVSLLHTKVFLGAVMILIRKVMIRTAIQIQPTLPFCISASTAAPSAQIFPFTCRVSFISQFFSGSNSNCWLPLKTECRSDLPDVSMVTATVMSPDSIWSRNSAAETGEWEWPWPN